MPTLSTTSPLANLTPAAAAPVSPFGMSYRSAVKTVWARMSGMLNALLDSRGQWERAGQDAYLAKAVSMYDLERRMRALEQHHRRQPLRMMTNHRF